MDNMQALEHAVHTTNGNTCQDNIIVENKAQSTEGYSKDVSVFSENCHAISVNNLNMDTFEKGDEILYMQITDEVDKGTPSDMISEDKTGNEMTTLSDKYISVNQGLSENYDATSVNLSHRMPNTENSDKISTFERHTFITTSEILPEAHQHNNPSEIATADYSENKNAKEIFTSEKYTTNSACSAADPRSKVQSCEIPLTDYSDGSNDSFSKNDNNEDTLTIYLSDSDNIQIPEHQKDGYIEQVEGLPKVVPMQNVFGLLCMSFYNGPYEFTLTSMCQYIHDYCDKDNYWLYNLESYIQSLNITELYVLGHTQGRLINKYIHSVPIKQLTMHNLPKTKAKCHNCFRFGCSKFKATNILNHNFQYNFKIPCTFK